jgi:outer membrane protein assembly factor BamB
VRTVLLAVPAVLLAVGLAAAENWPAWRGPTGQGHSADKAPPLTWNTKENIRWKTPLPEDGNSSPVVWGDRVFVTQATQQGKIKGGIRSLMCFDRKDGKLLWKKDTEYPEQEPTHGTNPFCAASPATDGERVVVSHGSAGLFCYDLSGKELWRKDLGKMIHIWGTASSPVLHNDLCILWAGPGEKQFLVALNKADGKEVWRHDEPGGKDGLDNKSQNWVGSWSTPVVAKVGDREELILGVPRKVKGFDPKTGKELWSCDGMGPLVYNSAVVSPDGIVVAMSGFHGPALAVKAGGSGDVTKTHRLWHHTQMIPQRIGSGVILGEHCYLINENGQPACFELKTGKNLWEKEQRVSGPTWSSLVAAAGRLYITSQGGETVVFKADPKLEVLSKNPLGERTMASPAFSDGEIFVRTYKNLWCIGPVRE